MKILGAILAGGEARRFGSDKAAALVDGKALLEHVADALRPQVDALVVAGRDWPGLATVADLPRSHLGPLGGLAGALDYARRHDFDAVLSCGCDTLGIPADLVGALAIAPAVLDDLPVIGLWPVHLSAPLTACLSDPANRSVYVFAGHVGARRVALAMPVRNINYPQDIE